MAPIGPFDYFPTIGEKAAEALDNDFEPFLRESALRPFLTGTKIPALMNDAMQASFFHETGNWWSDNNWARLKDAYANRIVEFKNRIQQGPTLYFYAICGAASIERIIDSYHRVLHNENSRLLIVNLLKDPILSDIDHAYVRLAHIPYPEDYTWTNWEEFTSDRGIAFEQRIIGETLEQIHVLAGRSATKPPIDETSILDNTPNVLSKALF